MTKTQTRLIEPALILWESLADDPSCLYDHVDDYMLAVHDMVQRMQDTEEECSDAKFFQYDLTMQVTPGGKIIFSVERIVHKVSRVFAFSQGDMLMVLDAWSSNA